MTEREIVRNTLLMLIRLRDAVECCGDDTHTLCKWCPYEKENKRDCRQNVTKDVVAFLNATISGVHEVSQQFEIPGIDSNIPQ